VRLIPVCRNAGFYATRHGYRLFWRLGQPLDVRFFESLTSQFIEHLRAEGIEADPACTDWTRLFRLPHATPEGDRNPIRLPAFLDHGILDFHPTLTERRMPSIDPRMTQGWAANHPPVLPPTPEGTALLEADKDLHKRVSKGAPLAEPGNRFNTMLRAVGIVTQRMANPTPEAVFGVLAYSVAVDKRPPASGEPKGVETLWDICKNTVAKELTERAEKRRVVDQLNAMARAKDEARNGGSNGGRAPQAQAQAQVETSEFRQSEQESAPSNAEPSVFAASPEADPNPEGVEQGEESAARPPQDETIYPEQDETEVSPPDDFIDDGSNGAHGKTTPAVRRIVVFTNSRFYYVLNERTASYHGPFDGTGLPAMIEKYAPNLANIRNNKGALISVAEILTKYGTEAQRVIAIIGQRGIEFDSKTKTIEEGVAAIRSDLTPKFTRQIHEWLSLFGGAEKEKFFDWLATFTDLQNPTCGLYLRSTGGTGKGLLAAGLARFWGTSPTMYGSIINTHNDALAQCPFVWADEEIPASHYGKTPSAVFRTLVGNTDFQLRRMYSPAGTLKGSLRLLVTANNDKALKTEEDLSEDDTAAIIQRIGYIHVPDAAKHYLERIGGRAATKSWVDGDLIARHVLWLQKTRKVKHGKRFLVDGWDSPLHRTLQATSGITGSVVEVIAYAVWQKVVREKTLAGSAGQSGAPAPTSASLFGSTVYPHFVLGNKHIYCTINGIYDAWEAALGPRAKPAVKQRIRASLQQIAATQTPVKIDLPAPMGGKVETIAMWAIRPKEIVQAISDYYQVDDAEIAMDAITHRSVRTR
jgi:hypothetical protein